MAVAGTGVSPAAKTAAWRRDPDLRFCRTCYDHLAGQVGIAVTDPLTRAGHIEPKGPRDWKLTESGELSPRGWASTCPAHAAPAPATSRASASTGASGGRTISGALGAAIADTFFSRGWAERLRRSRTVRLTDSGRRRWAATSAPRFALPVS